MGLGRTPHNARLMQRGVDLGERGRTEIEHILGELLLLELVTTHRGNTGGEQHASGELRCRPQHGERPGALLIDIEGEQRAHLRSDHGDGLGTSSHRGFPHLGGRSTQQLADMDLLDTALHPRPERRLHPIGENQRVLREPKEIIIGGSGR